MRFAEAIEKSSRASSFCSHYDYINLQHLQCWNKDTQTVYILFLRKDSLNKNFQWLFLSMAIEMMMWRDLCESKTAKNLQTDWIPRHLWFYFLLEVVQAEEFLEMTSVKGESPQLFSVVRPFEGFAWSVIRQDWITYFTPKRFVVLFNQIAMWHKQRWSIMATSERIFWTSENSAKWGINYEKFRNAHRHVFSGRIIHHFVDKV